MSRVKTRFLLLSDTHASVPDSSTTTSLPYRWPLPAADVAIHTGDLTMTGKFHEHEQAIDLLKHLQADLKIVIPGNHDLTLDTAYYSEKGHLYGPRPKYNAKTLDSIRQLYTGPEAQASNIFYIEEGTHTFQLRNGARLTVYASAYTPEFCEWAFAYPRDQDRFNHSDAKNLVNGYTTTSSSNEVNIDVMLTHGPPFGILDRVDNHGADLHVGCEHLLRAVTRAKPLLHCFGHIHEGWGAVRKTWSREGSNSIPETQPMSRDIAVSEAGTVADMCVFEDAIDLQRGHETLFVNSSIMSLRYTPVQAPWLVDLMLEKSK